MQFYSRDDMRYSVKWTKIVHQIPYFLSIFFFFFIKLSIKRLARLWFFFLLFVLFLFLFCQQFKLFDGKCLCLRLRGRMKTAIAFLLLLRDLRELVLGHILYYLRVFPANGNIQNVGYLSFGYHNHDSFTLIKPMIPTHTKMLVTIPTNQYETVSIFLAASIAGCTPARAPRPSLS